MSGDSEELRDDFCYSFSLTERIDSLPTDILDFEQLEKESTGAAWARFSRLLASIPDMMNIVERFLLGFRHGNCPRS